MITRIAIVGDDQKLLASLNQAVEDRGVSFKPLDKKGTPPPGTAAVIAPAGHSKQALDATLKAASEYETTLLLIAEAVDKREEIPSGATERVLDHATRFAAALALDEDDQFILERAAILRDIGKLSLSNDILLNKSVLTYDQWSLLKAHSKLGAELMRERGLCVDAADVVETHHECWDGDGYPGQLEKEEIPRLARALRIIDVYCAMTSPRLYRKNVYGINEALEYLKSERGKHFDPEMLDAFIEHEVGQMPPQAPTAAE